MKTRRRADAALCAAAALGILLGSGAAVAQTAEPGSVIERALESRTKGDPEARVVVFEIADFQCPFCARFAQTVAPELDERYVATGKIQWVFVNLPLHTHALAWHAAEAALCAGVAGDRFWPMHDHLFANQKAWGALADPGPRFEEYARELGVPLEPYRSCVAYDQVASLILQDVASSVSARIDGTPTFIIMKGDTVIERMMGVQSVEEWSKLLDDALQ